MEQSEQHDPGRGRPVDACFSGILERHLSRRRLLQGAASVPFLSVPAVAFDNGAPPASGLTFTPVAETMKDGLFVPDGYTADVVIRWGDPLVAGLPPFDVKNQSPADQAKRFGFNNDMIAVFPETHREPGSPGHDDGFLMCVNQEFTTGASMFPDYPAKGDPSRNHALVEMEAHGITVVRVLRKEGRWTYDPASAVNRRITATTPFTVTGPAAGHALLRTPADPEGTRVLGTFANCSGGFTPWGTYLSGEENFNFYFAGVASIAAPNAKSDHADFRLSVGASDKRWELYDPRFDLSKPEGLNEPYRFGYIVEVDPYDPASTPRKLTALGRCKHEAAQMALSRDARAVVYSGDDEAFEYIYKFVSAGRYRPGDRKANFALLETGTLYAARFNDDGTGAWLPLDLNDPVSGPKLKAARNADGSARFTGAAEIAIHTRRAADTVGATPMDRPEDVEPTRDARFIGTGKVYAVMTGNPGRGNATAPRDRAAAADPANPRANNVAGHIVEITESGNDVGATDFTWRIFLLAGDAAAEAGARVDVRGTLQGDRFAKPDNITFDAWHNMWISTDGNAGAFPSNDTVVVVPTGGEPGQPVPAKRFLVGPLGAEVTGPLVTEDARAFFCAIQHPDRKSTWPDGEYPRPSVVAVRRLDGGRVGS
jgi:secreted PhoX family phosphatase